MFSRIDFVALAKMGVSTLIMLKAADLVEDQLDLRTNINTDRIIVQGGCALAGQVISNITDPFTDKAIDALSTEIVKFKNRNNQETPTA